MIVHSKPSINRSDIESVIDVLKSLHLEDGDNVTELENSFCTFFDAKYAIAVSSGFASILLSLIALGINKGDEVIIPSYTCQALLNPIRILGATPIIVDISPNSFNIDVIEAQKHISRNTKAIIVPHIFGVPARIEELMKIGVPVIEDCAQALGGRTNGKLLGTFGNLAVFSFYSTKMICGGDGGLILTNDTYLYDKICDYRYYGHRKGNKTAAYNFHLTNLPAALALSQMKRLDSFIEKRRQIAECYMQAFSKVANLSIEFEKINDSCFYRFPIRVNDAELFIKSMKDKGIQCGYGVLDGMHEIMELPSDLYPNTTHNLRTIVSLPIYPELKSDEINYIINNVKKIVSE